MTIKGQRIWDALFGEERPCDMLVLLAILVILLHLWMLSWLMRPQEKITEAIPLAMEVSMVTIPTPKPVQAPPKPAPPPPPVEKKPDPPKQPKVKPVVKKPAPTPVAQEVPDFAPFEPFKPVEQPQQTSASSNATSSSSNTSTSASTTQTFTEANFKANYAHNPKPQYPAIAKSRGWQGKVLLRVKVSAEGLSESVAIEQSSGHDMLDQSAMEAVKKWRFIPAKRGDTPVASSVIVPIVFTLHN